jgi:hypothetical protein
MSAANGAEEMSELFKDPTDGRLDAGRWLLDRRQASVHTTLVSHPQKWVIGWRLGLNFTSSELRMDD